jgi:hypothetical protein
MLLRMFGKRLRGYRAIGYRDVGPQIGSDEPNNQPWIESGEEQPDSEKGS